MKKLKDLENHLNNLLYSIDSRFSVNELNDMVGDFLGFNVDFEKMETETSDFRLGLDLYLFSGKVLYVDVYYLLDNNGTFYITDYDLHSDNALYTKDYDMFITDSDLDLPKNSAYAFYIDNIDRFDEIASVLIDHDRFMGSSEPEDSLHGWFYTLIDEIKSVGGL